MKKTATKKKVGRTKKKDLVQSLMPEPKARQTVDCVTCGHVIPAQERVFFVEEELQRTFCTEKCINRYFSEECDRLEQEYRKFLSNTDLDEKERDQFAHLRWSTLQDPDEIWAEKTGSGDYRYTLISEYLAGEKPIWSITQCLFLRGEPSFLFLAFVTQEKSMLKHYKKGRRIKSEQNAEVSSALKETYQGGDVSDRVAKDGWSNQEAFLAELWKRRKPTDIPLADFEQYTPCLEDTLQTPSELWYQAEVKTFHFIREFKADIGSFWFVVVARETEDEDNLEIVEAFPTLDKELVATCRVGECKDGLDAEFMGRVQNSSGGSLH